MSRSQKELKLHQQCYRWFHNKYPEHRKLMWYTENEGDRNDYQQMIIKSLGLTSGVSDLMLFYGGNLHGIEFKTTTGRQSESQKDWQEAIVGQGGKYHIVRSLDDFKTLIKHIVGEPA